MKELLFSTFTGLTVTLVLMVIFTREIKHPVATIVRILTPIAITAWIFFAIWLGSQ